MLFLLTCLYMLVYYYQPGGRIPALGAIRFEFLLGSAILVLAFATRNNRIFTNERMTKAALLFFLGMSLSFIGAIQTHTASDASEVFTTFLKSFAIYLMVVATVDSKEKLEKFLWVYVACMAILVGEPFLLSLRGMNLYAKEDGVVRLYGVGQFAHPNGLGINAVTTLPLVYFCFKHYRSYVVKAFMAVFALICFRVIMLTASRSAYIGILIFIACLFFYSRRKIRFVVVSVLLTVALLGSVPDMYRERFLSLREVTSVVGGDEEQHGSVQGRWELIQDAWHVFLDYPLFGCGMDSFRRIGVEEKDFKTFGQTHNLLMQALAETGFVGFLSFAFLLSTMWKALATAKQALAQSGGSSFSLGLVESFQIMFLLKLLIGIIAQHSLYSHVWWLIGAFALVSLRTSQEPVEEDSAILIEGTTKPQLSST